MANSYSKWHIRPLTKTGQHMSGGIDTPSLCGRVDLKFGGWDVACEINPQSMKHACPECARLYLEVISGK